jgi:RNA polymerase sigma-70 factor (ECF subfamily)
MLQPLSGLQLYLYMTVQEQQAISDCQLVDRILEGETGLYELIMRRYNQRLFRVIRSVLRDDREAEDTLQESWVRIYEHLQQFANRSSFATWITRIAFHEALNRARKGRRWIALEDETGEIVTRAADRTNAPTTPEELAIRSELRKVLESAIDLLPKGYRSVFLLREVEGLSTAEAADCLELSEEAVKTRLHRARGMLRRSIEMEIGPAIPETYLFMGDRCERTVAAVFARIGLEDHRARK